MTQALDQRWALRGAILLICAFVCPLVIGRSWVFGPTLLSHAPPGLRTMALMPGIVGPAMLLIALKLKGLTRSMALIVGAGTAIILLLTSMEQLSAGQAGGFEGVFTGGVTLLPPPRTLLLFALTITAIFVGLALQRRWAVSGARIAGFGGAVLLALHLAPLGGRTPFDLITDPIAWNTAWPLPTGLVATGAFAVLAGSLLFGDWLPGDIDPAWLTRLTQLVGTIAVLAVPVGMVINVAAGFPELLGTTVTMMIKVYGSWLALHMLVAAGVIGLAEHGFSGDGGSPAAR